MKTVPAHHDASSPGIWIQRLALRPVIITVLILLMGGAIASASKLVAPTWALALPFFLNAISLFAVLRVHTRLRLAPGLFVFHLALLMFLFLVVISRLTYLKGWVEVNQGEPFVGHLDHMDHGPLHWNRLSQATFVNEEFTVQYAPGLKRGKTQNRVTWEEGSTIIGDDQPLVRSGYRFYTSSNKGFAPLFIWYPRHNAPPEMGLVRMPSYPLIADQSNTWVIPGTQLAVAARLEFQQPPLSPDQVSVFPTITNHHLVLTIDGVSHSLQPGEGFSRDEGTLVYQELRTWMGYSVFYDWTRPWLLATCLVGLVALAWHYYQKFLLLPWGKL